MNINLHIERLVFDDVYILSGQRHTLLASVEAELAQLLTDRGLSPTLAHGTALPHMSTSDIQLTDTSPLQLGQQIAQFVYGGIGHE